MAVTLESMPFVPLKSLLALSVIIPVMQDVVQGQSVGETPADEAHERMLGESVDYLSDVKPILVRRCYACHGPDADAREADLRLDDRSEATRMRDGYLILSPGRSDDSELMLRIAGGNAGDRMPPKGEPLSVEEIEIIRRWIDQGAQYDRHWSFKPVRRVDPPETSVDHQHLVRDPIDHFILQRIDDAGIAPAGDATPSAQLRRLAFDLTGLPPDPADVVIFEQDPSDERWNNFVDGYLDSPDFGERWARHWLDLVRYAETCGHEFDYPIHDAWRYRDYVIRALNDGIPYDRFLREHLAGDLLDPRIDLDTGINQSVLGTGFYHLHQAVHAPVDVRLDELDRVDNQIDVISKTFLGLTVSCARCHDHKFDPITQADYYGMAGYLRSSRRSSTYLDPGGVLEERRRALEELQLRMQPSLLTAAGHADDEALLSILSTLRDNLVEPGTPGSISTERVFEDFEGPDFGKWTVEGAAFARGPQSADTVRASFSPHVISERMVNTCDDRPGGSGDADTGTLTSPEFLIEEPVIIFMISGGRHEGETCVELLVDDQVVRTTSGRSDAVLREVRWDVSDLHGRHGRLRIADRHAGSWGHVVVDDIRLRSIPGCSSALKRPLDQLARDTGLTSGDVARWIEALHDTTIEQAGHPLHQWSVMPGPVPGRGPLPDLILDDGTGHSGWFGEGHAWPRGSTPPLDSGLVDHRFQGTLRSRTFTIEHEHLLLRVRGRGTVRLSVDGFMMDQFNPLLFEGFKRDINDPKWRVIAMKTAAYPGERAWIELIDDGDGSLEVDWIAFDDSPTALIPPEDSPEPTWKDVEVNRWLVANDLLGSLPEAARPYLDALAQQQQLARSLAPELLRPERALAMQDGNADEELILILGNHRTPASAAPRGLIAEISGDPHVDAAGSGRVELADAILDESNPLTSRVAVNRIWHHLYGRGIVSTTDDFGALGSMPSHPELLDHLAVDFSKDWSIKRMIGRIVRSSAYRRSSSPVDSRVLEVDPTNELLARSRVRRLQGEAIRDSALAISGRLDPRRFGKSVPIHLTEFMTGRGRPGRSGSVDGEGRRSIYLETRRNFPVPLLAVFDLPIPTTTIGRRNVSNVPAQSLVMMNDPFIHEMSRLWGKRSAAHGDLDLLWRQAFARKATSEELEAAGVFIDAGDRSEETWIELCHALMNTKEFTHLN
jgi:hypothetical protein